MSDKAEKTELEKKWEAQAAAEASADGPESPEPAEAEATPEDENNPVAELERERDDLKDQLLRARAEFDNYRKRVARVVDSIDLALSHSDSESGPLAEGVVMVAKQLQDALVKNGLEPIDAQGQPFDPELHDAMLRQPDDSVPPDTVLQEYQKGYKIGDIVLRHAKVVVSTAPENEEANSEAAEEPARAEE
jgi:molecular chaperone GrpE